MEDETTRAGADLYVSLTYACVSMKRFPICLCSLYPKEPIERVQHRLGDDGFRQERAREKRNTAYPHIHLNTMRFFHAIGSPVD